MIFIGAYPNSFYVAEDDAPPLQLLVRRLKTLVPEAIGLHLLPIHPSSGDNGFAPNDWFEVDPNFGTWDEIRDLAIQRKLIIDGVYNHVGIKHEFIKGFFAEPQKYSKYIYAYQDENNIPSPLSPRGGPVLRSYYIEKNRWQIWQTFSDSSVDIRLTEPAVEEYIHQHLQFLKSQGVWGVRLDGASYYAKKLNVRYSRHYPESHMLARKIATKVIGNGLRVIAQLDCDKFGVEYFPESLGYRIPIADYSYSAYLAYAILSGEVDALGAHIMKTNTLNETIIRCPRTHDGILLRSQNLDSGMIEQLVDEAASYDLHPRIIEGEPYEFNCSLPFLCSLGIKQSEIWDRLKLAIAITSFLPGWTYLYLPFLLGYIPEHDYDFSNDPRALNRNPISSLAWQTFVSSRHHDETRVLLEFLVKQEVDYLEKEDLQIENGKRYSKGLLVIKRRESKFCILANFNSNRSVDVKHLTSGDWLGGWRASSSRIEPFGFGIVRY